MEAPLDIANGHISETANPNKLLTVGDVADILQLHPNTIRHWADWGYLPSFRIGPRRDRRFLYQDVIDHLPKIRTSA